MTGFVDVFGGSTVQPSDVQFASVALSASITTAWPAYATGTTQVMARIMKVSASTTSLTISLPDATKSSTGQDVLFDNSGANTFTVLDFDGNVVATLTAGQVKYLYLSDATTTAGTWRVTIFGVGSSTLDASALSGYGLKAISNTINTAAVATVVSSNTTVTSADRSKIYVWAGASGTLTLPTTVGSTSDFAIEVRNQGTGTLTIATTGGVLIDASAIITLSVQESCFVHMGATDWYTVGRGRNTAFNFTQLTKNVTGGTTVLTLTEASNVVQKYTGALVSNATITLPAVVQVYYVSNETTGAYTLTFGCAGGGTSIAVTQAQAAILFCDGTNIINANTSLSSGISTVIFGAGSVTAPSVGISESATGLYSAGTHEIGFTCNGVYVGKWTSTGLVVVGTATAAAFSGPINGTVGAVTPATGAFTTLSASSTVSGSGFSTYLASPPAIGGTAAAAGAFTTLTSSSTTTLNGTTVPASKTLEVTSNKDAVSGYAGLSATYQLHFLNTAGTFTSLCTNANTAARTYAFPDYSETVATVGGTETLTNKTLTTPVLGVATATSINKMAVTAPATSSTLAVADGKTLTASNTLTLAGTDGTTITFQASDTYVGRATTDTLTNKTLTSPTINGGTHTAITSFGIRSTGAAFDLAMAVAEVLTAGRILTWKVNDAARTIDLGGNLTLAGALITSGAYSSTFTMTNTTTVTFPTTGTLATLAGSESLSNKTLVTPVIGVATATSINKMAITAPATSSTLAVADGKTLTASNTLTLAGTDATTLTFPGASANIGYLEIPQNSKSAAYTTVLADDGKHIYHPGADTTARTWTIDSNANVAYPIGTAITFINDTSGGVITIAITSDTMILAGSGTTGSRTLAANGIATAVKMTATRWIISGVGLT